MSACMDLPGIPRDADGPVFAEPWQAQAFAMAVLLHARGVFTWPEWAERLSAAIRAAQAAGDPDDGSTDWRHWMDCLESLAVDRGAASVDDLAGRRIAWEAAARRMPHGRPVIL
jgi:nitrile hydratase accessory protein